MPHTFAQESSSASDEEVSALEEFSDPNPGDVIVIRCQHSSTMGF
jgi:predicted RNA-binding Zn-ribbon protein involved in translation (DUF1610 family)